jgi:N-ethylmaleimide reductase
MNPLYESTRLGHYTLRNRLVMAPMTRSRADDASGVPSSLAVQYYAQRAGAGLIITEGTFPAPMGKGYVRTPGIHSADQIEAWKRIVQAVHARDGLIFLQLMHCGRISHPSLLPDHATPVAPSAIAAIGKVFTATGPQDFVVPRALETEEIPGIVQDYQHATRHALEAGFDGVELHAASGYLPEQFLSSETNHRTDRYGGSLENRVRFIAEVLAGMIAEAGRDRVGIKIAPEMNFNSASDATPQETYQYLVQRLGSLKPSYLHLVRTRSPFDYRALLRPLFDGALLQGGGFDRDSAESLIISGGADAAVFGSLYLANPDLVERFSRNAPLNTPDRDTFYSEGERGYIDYSTLESAQ